MFQRWKKWALVTGTVLFVGVSLMACTLGAEMEKEYLAKAKQGDLEAQFELSDMYLTGNGVDQSDKKGLFWLVKAGEAGHVKSQYYLGQAYSNGFGLVIMKDMVEGHMWLTMAANRDYGPAIRAMKDLEEKMTPEQLAQSKKRVENWRPRTN